MEQEESLGETVRQLVGKSDRLRIEFLDADLDLGFTFCDTARIEADLDPHVVPKLLEKIRSIIGTVNQFLPRVEDNGERERILARKEKLAGRLATIEPA